MRSKAGSDTPRAVRRVSTLALLALGLGACSSDTMRFTEAPFSNPFQTARAPAPARDPATTGSIGRVEAAPLQSPAPVASVRSQPLPPPQSAVALRAPAPQPVAGGAGGWSAEGGTPIVLAQGETLDVISSRYGVPRSALIAANGLSGPNVAPGTRLTIPVYNGQAAASAPVQAAPSVPRQVAQAPTRTETTRFVAGPAPAAAPRPAASVPQPQRAPSAAEAKAAAADEARLKAAQAKEKAEADAKAMRESRARFAAEAKAKAEARKTQPVAAAPVAAAKPAAVAEVRKPAPAAEKPKSVVVANAPAAEPKVTAVPKAEPAPVAEPKTTASLPKQQDAEEKADFRWPARGRVIQGFSGRGGNEGINIAVPEGTPVKAVEGGTVAYAGSELKGYGNLVLIRHPNGYVSAYAHNGELNVKRGDTVSRGQVVAKSGQTGNVSSPQLHFELRKGSTPVDPTPYLNN